MKTVLLPGLAVLLTGVLPLAAQQGQPAKPAAPVAPAAKTSLTFLGQPVTGSHVVICLDVSLSFRQRLEGVSRLYLRDEMKRFIGSLPETVRVNLITFHADADKFRDAAEAVTAASKEEMTKFMAPFLEAGENGNSQARTTKYGKPENDPDGVKWVAVRSDDFPQTKGTQAGSRVDMALLAAWSEKPETVILLGDEFPEVKGAGEKPVGNAKVMTWLQEAYKAGGKAGMKNRLTVFMPLPGDRKGMTAGQKDAPGLFRRLAEMTGGKALQIPEGKK